ncbi:hypothetical protein Tco_1418858 [Tanacetum coccineum]
MGNQRDVRALLLMDTSGLVPQRQKASDYDNPDPTPELQNVYPSADTTVPSQQELDLLFGPLYDGNFSMMIVNNASERPGMMNLKIPDIPEVYLKMEMCCLIQLKSDSLPQLMLILQRHSISFKIQELEKSRIKDKGTSETLILKKSSEIRLRGRFLARFQDDAKLWNVGQDTTLVKTQDRKVAKTIKTKG